MKNTRYRFEQMVQEVNEDTIDHLKGEFVAILESDKDYTRKADYIGFSILSLDSKIASIDEELQELKQIKKKLSVAKTLALTVGATVIKDYGIEKIEGAGISSITTTKLSVKEYQTLDIDDHEALIQAGYFLKEVDEDKILSDYNSGYNKSFIQQHCKVKCEKIFTLPKLKINKRKSTKVKEIRS